LNLTVTKKEEVQRLRAQIEELSLRYVRNLNDDSSCLLFSEAELVGLPPEYLKVLLLFVLFPGFFAFHSLNFNCLT
jgi:thimet oligopeptidase